MKYESFLELGGQIQIGLAEWVRTDGYQLALKRLLRYEPVITPYILAISDKAELEIWPDRAQYCLTGDFQKMKILMYKEGRLKVYK